VATITPEQMLKQTEEYEKHLEDAKKLVLKVGLPKENVGGKAYGNGMTVIAIGSVHEFGGTWNHPGGTPYKIVGNGKAVFVKKGDPKATGITKPHKITMPQRSFLRLPFLLKAKEIDAMIAKQFGLVAEKGKSAEDALGVVGLLTVNISKKAFTNRGYGKWKASKKKSGMTLVDKKILGNSITFFVTRKS
jgi:phage gpG-like protein